jgi:hypothetical protein
VQSGRDKLLQPDQYLSWIFNQISRMKSFLNKQLSAHTESTQKISVKFPAMAVNKPAATLVLCKPCYTTALPGWINATIGGMLKLFARARTMVNAGRLLTIRATEVSTPCVRVSRRCARRCGARRAASRLRE